MYLLGAPLRETEKERFANALVLRFAAAAGATAEDTRRASEQLVDYVYRALDRQINKARGLLSYNALLFAALSFAKTGGSWPQWWGRILALSASLVLLALFRLAFGAPEEYSTSDADFSSAFKAVLRRTYLVTASVYLTIAATIMALVIACPSSQY